MSLYIPGMEMPTSCDMCWALDDSGDYPRCRITKEQRGYNFRIRENRMDKCPLVPVPDHGRLIDADALLDDVRRHSESYFADDFAHEWVDKAPTVIPADLPVMYYPQVDGITPTVIPASEEGEG